MSLCLIVRLYILLIHGSERTGKAEFFQGGVFNPWDGHRGQSPSGCVCRETNSSLLFLCVVAWMELNPDITHTRTHIYKKKYIQTHKRPHTKTQCPVHTLTSYKCIYNLAHTTLHRPSIVVDVVRSYRTSGDEKTACDHCSMPAHSGIELAWPRMCPGIDLSLSPSPSIGDCTGGVVLLTLGSSGQNPGM